MSSLRNSLHRRNHKERSQLSHRARLGFLEKHKDYVLRARDYHSKQDRIQRLRQKAAERNKDEFYFGMNGKRTKGGIHVQERGNAALPVDFVKILKTQDENYVRTMRSAGLKKIDRLKGQLSLLADLVNPDGLGTGDEKRLDEEELDTLKEAGVLSVGEPSSRRKRKSSSSAKAKHVVFAEDQATARHLVEAKKVGRKNTTAVVEEPTNPIDLGWKEATPKLNKKGKQKAKTVDDDVQGSADGAATEHRSRLVKELSARLSRDRQLRYAGRELEMQRLLMGKGGRKKLRGVEKVEAEEDEEDADEDDLQPGKKAKKAEEKSYRPRVYKWKMERKR